jgi:hypothetical protein
MKVRMRPSRPSEVSGKPKSSGRTVTVVTVFGRFRDGRDGRDGRIRGLYLAGGRALTEDAE